MEDKMEKEVKVILCDTYSYVITRNGKPFIVICSLEESKKFVLNMTLKDHGNKYEYKKTASFSFAAEAIDEIIGV